MENIETITNNIEKGVLSAILFNPTTFVEVCEILTPEDFYSNTHKKIFNTMLILDKNDEPISEDYLIKRLGEKFEKELIDIISKNPITNLTPYLKDLKKLSLDRELDNRIKKISEYKESEEKKKELYKLSDDLIKKDTTDDIFEEYHNEIVSEEDTHFYIPEFIPIPHKTVSMFVGSGGGAKSFTILQTAIRFLLENITKTAFLWFSEDPRGLTKKRIHKIYSLLKLNADEIKSIDKRLFYTDNPTFPILKKVAHSNYDVNSKFYKMKHKMQKYDLIVFDPLIAFYGADENSNTDARQFSQLFTEWASNSNKSIIFIHHSSKDKTNGQNSRGASAFVDAVRAVFAVETIEKDTTLRVIKVLKDNYNLIGAGLKAKNKFLDIKEKTFTIKVFEKELNCEVMYEKAYTETVYNPKSIETVSSTSTKEDIFKKQEISEDDFKNLFEN